MGRVSSGKRKQADIHFRQNELKFILINRGQIGEIRQCPLRG